jgi:hypothetical protein
MREYRIGAIQILKELSTTASQIGASSKENLQKQGRRRRRRLDTTFHS